MSLLLCQNSIILATKDGNTYSKSDAILRIGQGLGRGTVLNPAAPIVAKLVRKHARFLHESTQGSL